MKLITFLGVMLLSPSMAMAALQPSDFAFGLPLSLDENGAIYSLTIPHDVYETVVQNDLGDLRVFNGANAVVPHVLRRPKAQTNLSEVSSTLPIFPFYDTGSNEDKNRFSVRVEKNKYGAIINVDSNSDEEDGEKRCSGYLINLEDEVIRIVETERIWTPIRGVCTDSESEPNKAVFEYDSAALFPINKVRLGFTEKNALVKASIFSRTDEDAPWRYRQGGIFYNLTVDESSLVQDTIAVGPVSHRFWRVEIFDAASADSGSIPVLELGWVPHELLFVARGEGPFVLAYGSARLTEAAPPKSFSALFSNVVEDGSGSLLKTATPGEKIELGGAGQLVPEPPPLPWKKWLLWGILVTGVVIIAWMAMSLAKGMAK